MRGATSTAGAASGKRPGGAGRTGWSPVPVQTRGTLHQSVLLLGTAQLGGPYGITNVSGTPDDRAVARLLGLAADLGVTHLDTARTYGHSERRIGAVLRTGTTAPLRVVTTVAPLGDVAEAGRAQVRRAVARSLTRSVAELDAPAPPTVLLAGWADAAAAGGAAWDLLREYRAAGVTDRIGVSLRSPGDLPAVLDLPDLGYLRVPCNVLDTRWTTGEVAARLGARPEVAVSARSVYLQGLLAAGSGVRWPCLDDRRRSQLLAALDRLVAELGRAGRADLCLAYVRAQPWVSSVVLGAETGGQLLANAELVGRPELTGAERDRVREALPPVPVELLDTDRWPAPYRC